MTRIGRKHRHINPYVYNLIKVSNMDKEQAGFWSKVMGSANHSITDWMGAPAKGNYFTGADR